MTEKQAGYELSGRAAPPPPPSFDDNWSGGSAYKADPPRNLTEESTRKAWAFAQELGPEDGGQLDSLRDEMYQARALLSAANEAGRIRRWLADWLETVRGSGQAQPEEATAIRGALDVLWNYERAGDSLPPLPGEIPF